MKAYWQKLKLSDRITWFILITGFIAGLYALLIEPFTLRVATWTVTTEKWVGQPDLKIAILSDIHLIRPWMTPEHLQNIVEKTNKLQPDIVVLLGDFVATHPFGVQVDPFEGLAPLKNLTAACGVYAVLGNHDLHPPSDWPVALEKTDIPVLQNQAASVLCHGRSFWVAGLKDLWWQKSDIAVTMNQITDSNPVIMLMHNPDLFVDIPSRVVLSLAGHTHGGQIRFPIIGAVSFVIPSRYGKRYVYGHIQEEDKDMIVSSGLGSTGLPLRFMAPPEISFITLTSSPSAPSL